MKLVYIPSHFNKCDSDQPAVYIKQEHIKIANIQIFFQSVNVILKVYQLRKLSGLMKKKSK